MKQREFLSDEKAASPGHVWEEPRPPSRAGPGPGLWTPHRAWTSEATASDVPRMRISAWTVHSPGAGSGADEQAPDSEGPQELVLGVSSHPSLTHAAPQLSVPPRELQIPGLAYRRSQGGSRSSNRLLCSHQPSGTGTQRQT